MHWIRYSNYTKCLYVQAIMRIVCRQWWGRVGTLDESKCVSVGGRVVQTPGARALAIAVFSVPAGDVFFSVAPAHLYISAKKKTLTLICFLLLFGAFFLLFPPACSHHHPLRSTLKTVSLSLFKLDKIAVNICNKKVVRYYQRIN